MNIGIGLFAAAAALAWVVAVVSAVRLSRRLSGRKSLGAMAVNGIAWFDSRNFQAEAASLLRAFKLAFAGFFLCVFAIAAMAALHASKA